MTLCALFYRRSSAFTAAECAIAVAEVLAQWRINAKFRVARVRQTVPSEQGGYWCIINRLLVMPRLNKAALQKHLQHLEKEELIEELLRLFTKFKPVNEHFQMEFGETTAIVVDAYKEKLRKVYFGSRVRRPRLSTAKKIISEFKKVALFDYDVIDLLLFRVENSIQFVNTFNYPNEPFYKAIQSTFAEAIDMIVRQQLQSEFKERCEKIVWFAGHTRYFGLHGQLWQLHQDAFAQANSDS